jgi:hypothetical protein
MTATTYARTRVRHVLLTLGVRAAVLGAFPGRSMHVLGACGGPPLGVAPALPDRRGQLFGPQLGQPIRMDPGTSR